MNKITNYEQNKKIRKRIVLFIAAVFIFISILGYFTDIFDSLFIDENQETRVLFCLFFITPVIMYNIYDFLCFIFEKKNNTKSNKNKSLKGSICLWIVQLFASALLIYSLFIHPALYNI